MRQKTNEENSSSLDQGQIMIILADSEDSLTALSDKTLDKYYGIVPPTSIRPTSPKTPLSVRCKCL